MPKGTPCSGPRDCPAASSASAARASAIAVSEVRVINAPTSGSSASARATKAPTASVAETSLPAMRRARSAAERSVRSLIPRLRPPARRGCRQPATPPAGRCVRASASTSGRSFSKCSTSAFSPTARAHAANASGVSSGVIAVSVGQGCAQYSRLPHGGRDSNPHPQPLSQHWERGAEALCIMHG